MKYFKFGLALLAFSVPRLLVACGCIMTPIEDHVKSTEYLVVAEVIELLDTDEERYDYIFTKPDYSYRVKIKISISYKGKLQQNQIIELNSTFSNCEIYYQMGGKYLLFLHMEGEKIYMTKCSYSEKLDNATDTIKKIEAYLNHK